MGGNSPFKQKKVMLTSYIVFSYLFIIGVLSRKKDDLTYANVMFLVFSPIFLPIFVGYFFAKK